MVTYDNAIDGVEAFDYEDGGVEALGTESYGTKDRDAAAGDTGAYVKEALTASEVLSRGYIDFPGVGEVLPINKENFPDDAFREYVIDKLKLYALAIKIKTKQDPMIEVSGNYFFAKAAIPYVTALAPMKLNITTLEGIEYFTGLKDLFVLENKLKTLDLRQNTGITSFACTYNDLELLDLRGNKVLNPFDSKVSFNIAFQSPEFIVLCDPGSYIEKFCEMYDYSYAYSIMPKRPASGAENGKLCFMVKEQADIRSILSGIFGENVTDVRSSDKSIAAVTKKGILKGKKPGEVKITGIAGGKSIEYPVVIEEPRFTVKTRESVSIGEVIFAESLITGTQYRPDGYFSSNEDVARVDPITGRIVVKGKGSAKISAMYGTGNSARKISFTLKAKTPSLNKDRVYLKMGNSFRLKVKGAKNASVSFSSSDELTIKVNSVGDVTGVSPGTARVYANVGGQILECRVTVVSE